MEVNCEKRLYSFKNLSLKWSFILYVSAGIIFALLFSVALSALFSTSQNNIQEYYFVLYEDEISKQAYLMSDGKVVQGEGVRIFTEDIKNKFSDKDSFLYDLYGALTVLIVPVVCVICILFTGVLFYRRKLKKPLAILSLASERIASGDLDFNVKYENHNEFGQLAISFETMRESLYETNRKMWRLMEERKRLNAAFAHDLRTPLTVLRGYCDFLLKYVPVGKISEEKMLTTLSTMAVYLKRLEGYTTTMSSLQTIEEIEIIPELINSEDICEELKNSATVLMNGKKLDFVSNGSARFCMDSPVVSQVFENLVSNAVRYAESEIKVVCCACDDIFSISVSDDGAGFTQDALKNAAEPYFRDEKDISDATHFGIGLYTSKLLCKKHGGSLLIENADGGKVTASFASIKEKTNS